ncbi:MAG TPA: zinc finger Ran-binding domain-containing protein [Gemmatimonadales bacterium]|jgi:hypothetical protein|nr:zinc finger Ran-binding domain-containing protein [Gemmatimonadales bacterium]
MAKPTESGSNAVQALLAERTQYEEWLSKLAGSNAPDAVRRRVQADYESRLGGIMASLREHADSIVADLDRLRSSETDLARRESEAQETMAEAELRHAVGEYTDSKWNEISRVQHASLDGVRKELSRLRQEIDRLSEVQALIEGDSAPPAESAPATPAPAPMETQRAPESPKPAPEPPKAAKPSKPAQSDDELDFLKSVAVEQSASLSPQNASDDQPTAEESVPDAAAAPSPMAAPTVAAAPAKPQASSSNQAKTLKCGECGTLNRPTEWYCERCGAELAAL